MNTREAINDYAMIQFDYVYKSGVKQRGKPYMVKVQMQELQRLALMYAPNKMVSMFVLERGKQYYDTLEALL